MKKQVVIQGISSEFDHFFFFFFSNKLICSQFFLVILDNFNLKCKVNTISVAKRINQRKKE